MFSLCQLARGGLRPLRPMEVVRVGGSVRDLEGTLPNPRRTLTVAQTDSVIAALGSGLDFTL